jgi:hypothetical protein
VCRGPPGPTCGSAPAVVRTEGGSDELMSCPTRSFPLFLDVLAPRLVPEPRIMATGDSRSLYLNYDVIWGKLCLSGIYLCVSPFIAHRGMT